MNRPRSGRIGTICPGGQRSEFRLVAGEQDALALFFAEAVGHMARTALTTVYTVPIASKLPAPALQRGEANAQQQSQLPGTNTCPVSIRLKGALPQPDCRRTAPVGTHPSVDGQRVRIRAPNALSSKSYLVASLEARHKKLQTPPGCLPCLKEGSSTPKNHCYN